MVTILNYTRGHEGTHMNLLFNIIGMSDWVESGEEGL